MPPAIRGDGNIENVGLAAGQPLEEQKPGHPLVLRDNNPQLA